jgi:hypothetical protein
MKKAVAKKTAKKAIKPQKPVGYALDPKRKTGPIVNRPARDTRAK